MAGNSRDEILRFVYEIAGQEGLDQLTAALAKAGEQGGEAGEKLQKSAEEVGALLERARDVESLQALVDKLAGVDEKLASAREGLAQLNATFSDTDKSSAAVAAQFASANKAVADLAAQHDALTVRVSTAKAALESAGVDTRNLGAAHDELGKKAQESAAKLADSAAAANRFGGVRQVFDTVFESFKHGVENVAEFGKKLAEITGIAGVVTSALAAVTGFKFFEVGAEEAISLDKALAQLRATTGTTGEQFAHLKETAEGAAESIGVTSTQAVQAMTRLASQFGSAAAAAQALPATLTLAKIASLDFNEAANIVGETIKAFGLKASDAGKVVDELASIAQKTGASVGDIAHEMDQIAPLAKAAGVDFTTTAAAVAELASKGIDARNSTAALRELFTGLSQPTSKLRQDLIGMGIDTSSLATILQGLHDKGSLAQSALDALSSRGRAGILALVQGGAPALQQFIDQLNGSAGSAKGLMDVLDNTFGGVVGDIKRDLSELAGSAVLGALDPLRDEIHKLDGEVKEFSKTDSFTQIKAAITDFASTAAKALDEFVHTVDWKNLGATIGDWASSVRDSLKSVGESATTLGKVFGGIGDIISGVWNVVKVVFTSIESATSSVLSGVTQAIGEAYAMLGRFSDSAKQKAEEWFALSKQYADNAKTQWAAGDAAAEQAVKSLGNLISRISDAGDASKQAAPKHAEHAQAVAASGEAAAHAADGMREFAIDVQTFTAAAASGKASAADLQAAFTSLGVTSQQKLAETAAAAKNAFDLIDRSSAQTAEGLADRQNAFVAYAKKALEASASLGQGQRDATQYMLESKASALGLTDQIAALEAQILGVGNANNALAGASGNVGQQMDAEAEAAKRLKEALDKLRGGGGTMNDLADATKNARTETEKAQVAAEGLETKMRSEMGAAQSLGQIMANTAAQFNAVSEAAGKEFAGAMDLALHNIGLTKVATNDLSKSMGDLSAAAADTTGFVSYFRALAAVQKSVQDKIDAQRQGLLDQVNLYDTLGTAAQKNFGIAGRGADALLADLEAQRNALQQGNGEFDLLGRQELGPLQQALDGAIQRTQALRDAAKAADDQYKSLAQSVHDALLQEQGDQSSLEDERHQKQLADLKAAAEAANQLNSDSYNKAVAEENQLHDLKMRNLAQQQAAANKSSASSSTSSGSGSSSSSSSGGASASGAVPQKLDITLNGANLAGLNAGSAQQLAQQLMPYFIQAIQDAARRSGH